MTGTRLIRLAVSFALLLLCALPVDAASARGAEARQYFCRLFAHAPELDGEILQEAVWQDLPLAEGYKNLRTGLPSAKQTSFRAGYTMEALFIGVVCAEPDPDRIHADRADGEIFRGEDSVVVFISSDDETIVWFAVNAIGSRTSSRTLKQWEAVAHTGTDSWSAEIALPWEVLGAFPAEGEIWHLNICRTIEALGNEGYSTWADLEYHPEEVENFGELRFEAIDPDQRKLIAARIQEQAIQEELLLYSRPDSGVVLQSGFSEDRVVYNQGPHVAPRLSPDTNRILLNSMEGGEPGVWIANRGGSRKERICDGSQATWSPSGKEIVLQRDGRLVERILASGEERLVSPEGAPALAFPSYVPESGIPGRDPGYRFICTDQVGRHVYLVAPNREKPLEPVLEGEIRSAPRCSPDGKTLAFQDGAHIYLMDLATHDVRQLTSDPGVQACPVWSKDGRSICYARAPSPLAEAWDICHVEVADLNVVNLIERRVHPGFDWSGLSPKPARTTEVAGRHLVVRRTLGTVTIENDWLVLDVSRDGGRLIPTGKGASATPMSLCVMDAEKRVADEIVDISVVEQSEDSVVMKASFVAKGDRILTATIRVPRMRPLVEVAVEDGAGYVGLKADTAFAVVPDRLANDLVFDSQQVAAGSTPVLPETSVVLGCLADSEAMVMLAASSDTPSFAVTNSDDGGRLTALTVAPGTRKVVIALLASGRMWQPATLKNNPARGNWRAEWEKPFHAEWRMAVRGAEAAYSRMWNVRDLGALGGQALPIDEAFVRTPETAVVYAWGRDVITPADVLVPTDILVDVWGIEGYLTRLDIEGIQGYRTADEWTPFREISLHRPGWHPALAHEEHEGEFGVLEVMGSVFPVDTDGVRSLLRHLGNDALGLLRGLDDRIVEYEQFLRDLAAFCDAHENEDQDGFLASVGAQANELLQSGRNPRRTTIPDVEKAFQRVLAIVGTRDRLTLATFEAFCRLPGNEAWAAILDEFRGYLAAKEGRLWHNGTVRFELWYDDDFGEFSRRCLRFVAERQRILSKYRTWAKRTCDSTAQLMIAHPEFKITGDELRHKTRAVLRNRYYLEGDWRGETPLPTGAAQ